MKIKEIKVFCAIKIKEIKVFKSKFLNSQIFKDQRIVQRLIKQRPSSLSQHQVKLGKPLGTRSAKARLNSTPGSKGLPLATMTWPIFFLFFFMENRSGMGPWKEIGRRDILVGRLREYSWKFSWRHWLYHLILLKH